MIGRKLLKVTVLALTGVLIFVLMGHLWERHSQVAEAFEFGGIYKRYLPSQAEAPADATVYGNVRREASALEE
jgi:hypothetical protein